jgi:hypothetical protein
MRYNFLCIHLSVVSRVQFIHFQYTYITLLFKLYLKKIRLTCDIMEATGRVIKKKCFNLKTKQSDFFLIWEVNGQNLGNMSVYRIVGELFAVSSLLIEIDVPI